MAAKGQITDAILVAGDSDFLPAVEAAKAEGILLRLFHGHNPHNDLRRMADERVQIDAAFIERIRRR
ncbi:MAG: NYN domain-containing protein [Thermoleophilaceae bacterium]